MKINVTKILERYAEPHRYYHNTAHVMRMMYHLNDFNASPVVDWNLTRDEYHAIATSILYHDVVYDVVANTVISNEQASALYFLQDAVGQDPGELPYQVDLIRKLILCTQYHFGKNPIWEEMTEREIFLSKILLDMDLMSFTDDYADFKETNENLRREYETEFSAEATHEGRLKFLRHVLDNRALHFYTIPEREFCEKVAYANVERYLSEIAL